MYNLKIRTSNCDWKDEWIGKINPLPMSKRDWRLALLIALYKMLIKNYWLLDGL